jgi:hypothetical protein
VTADSPPSKPFEGAGIAALAIAGLSVSFALFTWAKIWIVPPVLPYTPLVYLLMWLPLWAFVSPKHRPRAKVWRLVILLAVVTLPCCCVIYAPSSGVGIVFEPWTVECVKQDADGSQVIYLCRSSSYRLEFKGVNWLPFVHLENIKGYDSGDPPPLPSEGQESPGNESPEAYGSNQSIAYALTQEKGRQRP